MKYYSTNGKADRATLHEAVVKGLASDKGLFMPEVIRHLPESFFDEIQDLSFQEVAYRVADAFFGEDVPADTLKQIVYDTLNFDCPVVKVTENIYSLELFHGPTLAFKDVGARFMARLLGYFIKQEGCNQVNVLVATSGDTGSAVANGFLGVEGIHVHVLYPKGKVSAIQECQFTTLGQNITALEVDGVFDGEDITNLDVTERARRGVSFAFQQPVRFKGITVRQLIETAAKDTLNEAQLCEILGRVGLCARDYIDREVNATLSGGEIKRIEIATVLARHTSLSIFDEPEAGIDLWSFKNLIEVFQKMHDENKGTLVIISHQERILRIADEIVLLADGAIQASGEREQMMNQVISTGSAFPGCRGQEDVFDE